jgi:hypothetical protein
MGAKQVFAPVQSCERQAFACVTDDSSNTWDDKQ